jgi:hypothetical protein
LIELQPFAVKLAWMGADVAKDARKRELLTNRLERFTEPPGSRELDVEVSVDPQRTPGLAVGRALAATVLEKSGGTRNHLVARFGRRSVPGSATIADAPGHAVTGS